MIPDSVMFALAVVVFFAAFRGLVRFIDECRAQRVS